MKIEHILLIKSTCWEILSAILGFAVVYIVTGQLSASVEITFILLILKSVLLAIYDKITYPLVKKFKK